MDIKTLVRDASRVHACLEELPNGSVVCTQEVKIYIPTRFTERNLAYIVENYILGVYAIVVEDLYYGVSLVNAMINIEPTSMNRVKVEGDEYLEFVFCPGATVFKSTNLVKTDTIPYKIYDEMISKGYIPWYVGYEELGHLFDSALHHAGANIGGNQEVTQLIASMVARDPSDRTKYYRTKIEKLSDLRTAPPIFIPLNSVEYSSTNTTNKLGGSYFSVGVVSALIDKTTRQERIENLLLR